MLTELLIELGVTGKEQNAYLALVRNGALTPAEVAEKISVPRTTAQNILIRLKQKELASAVKLKSKSCFEATHPEVLKYLLQIRKKELIQRFDNLESLYNEALPDFVSLMQRGNSFPQVRFFRGKEGAREVLFDTLKHNREIKDFANIDAMFDVFQDVNDEYVKAREKSSVTKRSLLLDTPFARGVYEGGQYSPKSHKGYKWIPPNLYKFTIEMNIYSGRVSYLTYVKEELIGVIIENKYIFEAHDAIWNLLWDLLPDPFAKTT